MESAQQRGRAQFYESRREKKMLNSSRDKNEGTLRRGKEGPLRDLGSELLLEARRESSARIIHGMEKKNVGLLYDVLRTLFLPSFLSFFSLSIKIVGACSCAQIDLSVS